MSWKIVYTRQARKDVQKILRAGLKPKVAVRLEALRRDPFETRPPVERLVGDLREAYSRRINMQHRLAYQVLERERTVKILRMWSHYE